jgi:SAM-dependent methyltransferase
VTLVDLSPEQLKRDQEAARDHNLEIECLEADMLDLSVLANRHFDLVYQPISAMYIPEVRSLYEQVFSVVEPGGHYWIEHWNPSQMQLSWEDRLWHGGAYRLVHPQSSGHPVPWWADGADRPTCLHYIHPLEHLIGGLCDVGFVIVRFAERSDGDLSARPGTRPHLDAFLPAHFRVFAQRPRRGEGLV